MSSGRTPEPRKTLRIGEAVSAYLTALPAAERDAHGPTLTRFVRWLGADRELNAIIPIELERYQEQLGEVGLDPAKSLDGVRSFLAEARKRGWTSQNLATHIRIRRKATAVRGGGPGITETQVQMTQAGLEALQREADRLEREVRPQLTDALQKAAADKDLRENAPYHAAKEQLSEVQSRINSLRATIAAASIVEIAKTERVGLGSRVVLQDLEENEELTYTLVGPGEIDARRGRISVQSPVARALMDHLAGDTVEVQTPAGVARYRIERVEVDE
jgi:transcription elongation factor GreA